MESRLPRKFAIVGVVVGIALMAFWWYDNTFNRFHLPTLGQALTGPANYDQPVARSVIEDLEVILCPGLVFQLFDKGIGGWSPWVTSILAVLINAPLYFVIGLGVDAVVNRIRRTRATRR